MLILAGVSISATVGDNGVLTKAQKAVIENKKASILEQLNLKLAEYNINTFTNQEVGTKEMLTELLNGEYIEGILCSDGTYKTTSDEVLPVPRFDENNKYTGEFAYGVTKEDFKINIYTANDGIYKAEFGEINFSSGGSVQAGTVLVTQDSFNTADDVSEEDKGKFTITENSDVIFIDKIEGELSFYIKSGAHAKVNIFNDMTLTNQGMKRSAIDIEEGGTLDIYVAEGVTLTVNSALGDVGETATGLGAKGGHGGYAGINVPGPKSDTNGDKVIDYQDIKQDIEGKYNCAVLNLSGAGTVIAYGGNAGVGAGANTPGGQTGGGGGGGAGAGIGGNGGNGGGGNKTFKSGDQGILVTQSGADGENGEDCGIINILNTITVKAYGGAGGGTLTSQNKNSGCGAGGYPAAGIGGGRSWRPVVVIIWMQAEDILEEEEREHVLQMKMVKVEQVQKIFAVAEDIFHKEELAVHIFLIHNLILEGKVAFLVLL